jgi:ATP-dependent DNA helicase RecQ
MQDYVRLTSGHMDFLIRALDGEPAGDLTAAGAPLRIEPAPDVVDEAVKFLRGNKHVIEPRKRWPADGMPNIRQKGNIPQEERNEEGRALCLWGDSGWGALVGQGKFKDGCYDDRLVTACADLVRRWGVQPAWITWVPSQRHPELIPNFARRLAEKLNLPAVAVIHPTREIAAQKEMRNSVHQARNVDGAFAVDDSADLPEGAVLLVDDIVDSRWTLTVVGRLLRRRGIGPVWPLALAWAGNQG